MTGALDHDDGPVVTDTERERWLRAVRGVVLKAHPDASDDEFAAAFERQLVTLTDDAIAIQPLYVATEARRRADLPGFAPFVRSTHPAPHPWEIRQRVWADVDGSSAVVELENGATGVVVDLPSGARRSDVDAALDGVYLDLAPVSFETADPETTRVAAGALLDRWRSSGVEPRARRGSIGVDPLGTWLRAGGSTDLASHRHLAAELVGDLASEAPEATTLVADGVVWHEAGATDAQELGWTIAAAATAVRSLVEHGIPIEVACASIEFRWAATADQFATIAKLRAARRLWSRVAEIAGLAPDRRTSRHHASTSRVMLTRYDPWVNTLRSTVACFAAAVGGADAITVWPHDAAIVRGGTDLGRRIARNTQTVLQYETNLARVVDMAGGSWFVEQLTDELAATAWGEVCRIESAGGVDAAVHDGLVHASIADATDHRRRAVATRRRPLTGLSEFPDIDEPPPLPSPLPAHESPDASPSPFPPLTLHRLSDDFEAQRGRADRHAEQTGARPAIYLATLGTVAAATPRATFAKNLFEAGGIVTVAGPVDGFAASGLTVACLCSSDDVYRDLAAGAVDDLRAAGATRVYIAGRRTGVAGVDEEIGVGSDVLDVVRRALDELGVA